MTFWIIAALLAAAAVGFALAPFLRRTGGGRPGRPPAVAAPDNERLEAAPRPGAGAGRDTVLRALYRQRVEELDDEAAAGILDESSRSEMEQELGQGLLDEFANPDASQARGAAAADAPGGPQPASRGVWLLVAVSIPLLAALSYLKVGEPDAERLRESVAVLELDPDQDRLELDRWRVWLAGRLERAPQDAQSHYLLGRIYLHDAEYGPAAESFARAHALVGDDPNIDLAWLQALYLANGGRLDASAMRIAQRLLAQDPNQPLLLEMMAIDAYRRGDYGEAVGLFSRALGDAREPVRRTALEHFLKQARSMLGNLPPSIDVQFKALETPPASATLFVIARPVGGGMPFAVVRRAAAPLPDSVRLDDAVSMNPALPLSGATEIEVVARISLTGAAAPHPGDWEWRSVPLALAGADSLALVAELKPPDVD